MNNYYLTRKNVKVACVVDSVWRTCQLLQQYLFQCLHNYMNVEQGSTRRRPGCGFEYVCARAHALDSTWPRPGALTLDLLIFSYNYIILLLIKRACLRFCCLSIPSIVVLVRPTKGVLEPPLATPLKSVSFIYAATGSYSVLALSL